MRSRESREHLQGIALGSARYILGCFAVRHLSQTGRFLVPFRPLGLSQRTATPDYCGTSGVASPPSPTSGS